MPPDSVCTLQIRSPSIGLPQRAQTCGLEARRDRRVCSTWDVPARAGEAIRGSEARHSSEAAGAGEARHSSEAADSSKAAGAGKAQRSSKAAGAGKAAGADEATGCA